jgi:hypothetical protein
MNMTEVREQEKSSDYYATEITEEFNVDNQIIKGTIRTYNTWCVDEKDKKFQKPYQTYLIKLDSTKINNYDYLKKAMQLATEYKQKTEKFNLDHGSK